MTLREVIQRLDEFSDDLTIYAERTPGWTGLSRAMVVSEPDAAEDLAYFLEVDLAREAIRVWSEWRNGAKPTDEERFEAVRHYATFDAYLPVDPP